METLSYSNSNEKVSANAGVKNSQNDNSYMRNLSNMRVIVISFVIGALRMASKRLERGLKVLEIGGRMETMETTILRSTRILWRVLVTWGDLLSF